MGFAVDEQNELMNTYGREVEQEAPWPQPFVNYAEIITKKGAASRYAQKLVRYYQSVLEMISESRSALVVNHGGVVELGVVCSLQHIDFSTWGELCQLLRRCKVVLGRWQVRECRSVESELINYGVSNCFRK